MLGEARSSRRQQGAAEMTVASKEAVRAATLAMPRTAAAQAGDRPTTVGDEVVIRQAPETEPICSPLEGEGTVGLLLAGRKLLQPPAMLAPDLHPPLLYRCQRCISHD